MVDDFLLEIFPNGMLPVFSVASALSDRGMTDRKIRQEIFTEKVFDKMIEGKIVTERELNGMREILSLPRVQAIVVDELDYAENRDLAVAEIMKLPLLVQIEGFAKKLKNGVGSVDDMLAVLRNVEEKSMYRVAAGLILEAVEEKNKRKGNRIVNAFIKHTQIGLVNPIKKQNNSISVTIKLI